jgi:hypothetical protein
MPTPRHARPTPIDGRLPVLDLSELSTLELAALLEKAIEAEEAVELAMIERRPYSFYDARPTAAARMCREVNAWRAELRAAFIDKFFAVP